MTNSFTDNTVVCDTVNIKELSANRVGPYDKDNSSVNCVGYKHIINQFHWHFHAKTFLPGGDYTHPIFGQPITANQFNFGLISSKCYW